MIDNLEEIERVRSHYPEYAILAMLIVLSIGLGVLIHFLILRIVKLYHRKRPTVFINSVIKHIYYPLLYFFPILLFAIFSPIFFEATSQVYRVIAKTDQVLLILTVSWLFGKVVFVVEDTIYDIYKIYYLDDLRERKIKTQVQFVKRIILIIIVIVAISLILISFEDVRKVGTGLLTSAGILGVIVGFAAQKSIANLLAGFQIAFTQPLRINDVLFVEKEWGTVEEITLTYVVVRVWDRRRLVLPIDYFMNHPFQNWSRNDTRLLGTIYFYTDYKIPVQELREVLMEIVKTTNLWDGDVCNLQVTNATEKTMEIRVVVSAGDSYKSWDLRCLVREELIKFVQEKYPHCLPKMRAELLEERKLPEGPSGE